MENVTPRTDHEMLEKILERVNEISERVAVANGRLSQVEVRVEENLVAMRAHIAAIDRRQQKVLQTLFEGTDEEAAVLVRLQAQGDRIGAVERVCAFCGFVKFQGKVFWAVMGTLVISVLLLLIDSPQIIKKLFDFAVK